MRRFSLALVATACLVASACASTRSPERCNSDGVRPLPGFRVEHEQARENGVSVVGPYTRADVEAALDLVRARTNQWIGSIEPPQEILLAYRCGRASLEALPRDRMEVFTARDREQIHSSGTIYLLSKRRGVWVITDTSWWTS